jgi:O-antigen biosynthesis protein WbqP
MLKRAVDIALSGAALAVAGLPLLALMAVVRLTSPGPALHWSERVGRDNRMFGMPKLRTMRQGAPQLATHLFSDAEDWTTPIGRLLRDTSLDELPQLLSVLKGDMSLVGPRPALFNQDDLVALRTEAGVHRLRPGLTGWAQVNGRDALSLEEKVRFDAEYLRRRSLGFDLQIMLATAVQLLPRRLRPR